MFHENHFFKLIRDENRCKNNWWMSINDFEHKNALNFVWWIINEHLLPKKKEKNFNVIFKTHL